MKMRKWLSGIIHNSKKLTKIQISYAEQTDQSHLFKLFCDKNLHLTGAFTVHFFTNKLDKLLIVTFFKSVAKMFV